MQHGQRGQTGRSWPKRRSSADSSSAAAGTPPARLRPTSHTPTSTRIRGRALGTAGALVLAGIGFAGYPALRPFTDETTLGGAAAYASPRWLVAHTTGMAAFLLLALGLYGIAARLRDTGILLAVGLALYIPQYAAGQPIRVAHGVLLTAGCAVLGAALLRRATGDR